jgi:hypothetical protein
VDPRSISLITDILENPEIYENDLKKEANITVMWDSQRLPSDTVDYYLNQMKKLWPHSEYYY